MKCPWGCSKYYNHINKLEFGAIMDHFVPVRKKICRLGKGKVPEGMRLDFLKSAHRILYNPDWLYLPTIMFHYGKDPMVVCCKYHSSRLHGAYVHLPTNPMGCLYSPSSDQFAQAIIQPRTMQICQVWEYTPLGTRAYGIYRDNQNRDKDMVTKEFDQTSNTKGLNCISDCIIASNVVTIIRKCYTNTDKSWVLQNPSLALQFFQEPFPDITKRVLGYSKLSISTVDDEPPPE